MGAPLSLPRPGPGVKPVHVAFPAALSVVIRRLAAEHGVTPNTFVSAAIGHMIAGDLLDAVFDGENAGDFPIGHGRKANGLTHLQCAILAVFVAKPQRTVTSIVHAVNSTASHHTIASSVKTLERRGLVRRSSGTFWELTDKGRMFAGWLTGPREA